MSPEVVDGRSCQWIERRYVARRPSTISAPGCYGGEPPAVPAAVVRESWTGLPRSKQRYGIKGEFYSSSNGVLLTDELAEATGGQGAHPAPDSRSMGSEARS